MKTQRNTLPERLFAMFTLVIFLFFSVFVKSNAKTDSLMSKSKIIYVDNNAVLHDAGNALFVKITENAAPKSTEIQEKTVTKNTNSEKILLAKPSVSLSKIKKAKSVSSQKSEEKKIISSQFYHLPEESRAFFTLCGEHGKIAFQPTHSLVIFQSEKSIDIQKLVFPSGNSTLHAQISYRNTFNNQSIGRAPPVNYKLKTKN